MRALEFLREYSRDITAKNLGPKLVQAAMADRNLQNGRQPTRWNEGDIPMILQFIENKDPTTNKQYTQWLSRVYCKGGVRLEDLNRHNLLGVFDLGKRRRMIPQALADINRYPTYKAFEDMMDEIDVKAIETPDEGELQKGTAETLLNTPECRVVYPKDQEAAIYYGQGTKWCTAATKSHNYFDQYNRQGPMYILLPKNPEYEGEKYQLHFPSQQFMDKNDDQFPLDQLLKSRFPSVAEFFLKQYPEIYNYIAFASDEVLLPLLERIKELAEEHIWDELSDWQVNDDYYHTWQAEQAKERGYVDADGEVDWDRAYEDDDLNDYTQYSDEARRAIKDAQDAINISPDDIRSYENTEDGDVQTISNLDYIVGDLVEESLGRPGRQRDGDWGLGRWIKDEIVIQSSVTNDGTKYSVTLRKRDKHTGRR